MLAAFSQHGSLDPQLAKVLIEMNDYALLLTWAVDAVLFAAVAASALRTGALPRWLAISRRGHRSTAAGEHRPAATRRRPSASCSASSGS